MKVKLFSAYLKMDVERKKEIAAFSCKHVNLWIQNIQASFPYS